MAFVLAPSAPLSAWLAEVDKWSRNSPDFFVGRAIILDLAGVALSQSGISELLESLADRHQLRVPRKQCGRNFVIH